MVDPTRGVSSRRERNWEKKYRPVMSSTAELQRLRTDIQRLQAADLVWISSVKRGPFGSGPQLFGDMTLPVFTRRHNFLRRYNELYYSD